MTESQIERAACLYAKSVGMLAYKFTSPGRAGVPDRLFLTPTGGVFFVEFKCATGRVSALQKNEHRIIRKHGHEVHVVWDFNQAKQVIDEYIYENNNKKGNK
jgi:hypothetical protein